MKAPERTTLPASKKNGEDRSATLELLISIARAFKAVDDCVRPRLAAEGLSTTEFAVLEVLHHKGPIPQGEMSERILVTGASTTYTVNKLEKRGLLRRKASVQDQRVIFAELTPSGRALIDAVFPRHVLDLQRAMRGLTTEEKRTVARLLRKLREGASSFGS